MDEQKHISVSRDHLRADLAEMELRLRVWLTGQLDLKANRIDMDTAFRPVNDFMQSARAGDLTAAQRRTIDEILETKLRTKQTQGWTGVSRVVLLLTAISIGLNIFLAVYGLQ